jgi:hypothetical protein
MIIHDRTLIDMRERIAELQTEFEARAQPVFEAPAIAAEPARAMTVSGLARS